MKKSEAPILVEKTYAAGPDKVWAALTELKAMRQWFFDLIPAFEARQGFQVAFALENEGRTFTHQWEILEVIPQKLLKYGWKYAEYPGDSHVYFSIEKIEGMTKLRVETEVLEDFPDDIPEFKRESGVAGWEYLLGESLKKYLESVK